MRYGLRYRKPPGNTALFECFTDGRLRNSEVEERPAEAWPVPRNFTYLCWVLPSSDRRVDLRLPREDRLAPDPLGGTSRSCETSRHRLPAGGRRPVRHPVLVAAPPGPCRSPRNWRPRRPDRRHPVRPRRHTSTRLPSLKSTWMKSVSFTARALVACGASRAGRRSRTRAAGTARPPARSSRRLAAWPGCPRSDRAGRRTRRPRRSSACRRP